MNGIDGAGYGQLSTTEQLLVETRVTNEKKSVGAAYLLWFFLGIFSAHRFYVGKPVSAIIQIASYFILIGFIWLLVDVFLIGDMVKENTAKLRAEMMRQYGLDNARKEPDVYADPALTNQKSWY